MRNNYLKAKIDDKQKDYKWRLYGDTNETVHHINEFGKNEQKEY